MSKVKDFGALCGEYQDLADFITVYIAEAHPLGKKEAYTNGEVKLLESTCQKVVFIDKNGFFHK